MYKPVHQKRKGDPVNWLVCEKFNNNLHTKVCGASSEQMAWDIFSRHKKAILKIEIQKENYAISPIS